VLGEVPESFFDFQEGVWLEDLEGYLGQRSEPDFSHGSSPNTSLNDATFLDLVSFHPFSKVLTALGLDINSKLSTQLSNSSALISCKNLYFFFQTVSGEIVKVISNCPGKTSVCHPRSLWRGSILLFLLGGGKDGCPLRTAGMTGRGCTGLNQIH